MIFITITANTISINSGGSSCLQGVKIVHEKTRRLATRRQIAEHLRVCVRRGNLVGSHAGHGTHLFWGEGGGGREAGGGGYSC